jgi:hypothetical protein
MYGAPAEQKIWKTDVTFLFLTSKSGKVFCPVVEVNFTFGVHWH